MSWFRLKYGKAGNLLNCETIEKPEAFSYNVGAGAIIVEIEADSEAEAKRKSYNFYCAKKKKVAKERNHEAGNCACSRKQDRPNTKTGVGFFKTCSVCTERGEAADLRHAAKKKAGLPLTGYRDEVARVETLRGRVRDRKNEIRLETLIEVRSQWENARTNGAFTAWLKREISISVEPRKATDAA